MIDVDALLERERRRRDGLRKGGLFGVRTYGGRRDDAESTLDRPELRWPSQRHQAPRRCHHCRSTALETDAPYGLVKSGETRCMLCSRVVCRWRADNTERAPLPPEEAPRRGRPFGSTNGAGTRCDNCGTCPPCRQRRWRERQQGVTS